MPAKRVEDKLGIYVEWASGFDKEGLNSALRDQAILREGQLRDGDEWTRYTPAQLSQSACDTIRADRDDMDYREWNEDTGYSGVNRWPDVPGVHSEGQKRRRKRRQELEEGF